MSDSNQMHLLLVESDPVYAASLEKGLAGGHFQVTIAHTGKEAIASCADDPSYDLVLADISLDSSMNGFETARIIMERHDLPVVFLADNIDNDLLRKYGEVMSYGIIPKTASADFVAISATNAIRLHRSTGAMRLRLMFLEAVANSAADGILVIDLKGQKILQNNRTIELWKIPPEVVSDPDGSRQVAHVMSMTKNPKQFVDEIEAQRRNPMQVNIDQLELVDGTVLHRHSSPVPGPDGRNYGRIYHFHDVTGFKKAENEIRGLLAEKEIILKEAHHRVKNYMSTLLGLLSLQASSLNEPSAVQALEEAQRRIQGMVLLYDKLYVSHNFKEMSVVGYIPNLINEIIANFPNSSSVVVETHIADFILDANKMQVIGIIINELLTNIMKYAFREQDKGMIVISISREDQSVILRIQDNGSGMPESFDPGASSGFGLRLVHMLAGQMGGAIEIGHRDGTVFTLTFHI